MPFETAFFLKGLMLGFSLILAIGAQNAFVLRQGLARQQPFWIAFTSALGDALLITLGALGVGTLISSVPLLKGLAMWGGALFLLWFSFKSFRSALQPATLDSTQKAQKLTVRAAILTSVGFSLLNPHAILDTVVLIGSISGQYRAGQRWTFAAGSIVASFVWFFALAYLSGFLAPLFRKPITWRVLDVLIGLVMLGIAVSLVLTH
ncbi:LysE/ArgO family amino acid transporter [Deinococcus roseus]|uniref:Amino acid transporter n=1 Tax=Deinococcus roseus TaxID=392414 RepID=A0ABQ2CTG1_9DEIO|nr:LysE/ArgO family amino acid transporter [Deinococcus roseus]GGJ18955.1 amino acid transporter [Deinococcus roseus]